VADWDDNGVFSSSTIVDTFPLEVLLVEVSPLSSSLDGAELSLLNLALLVLVDISAGLFDKFS
jgi:hypothetical protein